MPPRRHWTDAGWVGVAGLAAVAIHGFAGHRGSPALLVWPVLAALILCGCGVLIVLQGRRIAFLADTQELQKLMLGSSPNAVIASDGEGRILIFNPAAERIFALSSRTAVGRRLSDMIAPVPTEAGAPAPSETILDRIGERMEREGRRGDGSTFPAEVWVLRIGRGRHARYAAYIRDLTEQRHAAAAREEHRQRVHQMEKLSAMGSLLAGVAHELNNPLAILVTQATLLRDKAPTPDVERRAERIYAAAHRAGRIVKSFLAMARQKTPVREPIELNPVIESALELVGYGLRSAGITVERRLAADLPLVDADRDLLGQVFANLILNAQQALLDVAGERIITIISIREDGLVQVDVSDNGPGVPDGIRDRIFEPYFTTKPAGAGTGIGLSVSRSFMDSHDGFIDILPTSSGATFRVRLPAIVAPPLAAPGAAVPTRGDLSVLVVDDELDVGASLAELIGLLGHRTVMVSSGLEALQRIEHQRFDAVFTDLRMPGMNGLSLRQAIKDVDATLAARTVIMTGDTVMSAHRNDGAPQVADAIVLEKPFTADDVRAVLGRVWAA